MTTFTLELFAKGNENPTITRLHVESESHVWSHVLSAARRLKGAGGGQIRVRDGSGGIVVLTSAAAALYLESERLTA
jgi:hypothetical protein